MNKVSYQDIKDSARIIYAKIGKIYCPALAQRISFSSEGFNHLIFKNSRSPRDESSQILRFKLINLAQELISKTTTYQEFEEKYEECLVKIYKRKVKQKLIIKYWGIIAIMHHQKIKVILKQKGQNGNICFWSIIPAWTTNKYRDIKFFSTMKGKPKED